MRRTRRHLVVLLALILVVPAESSGLAQPQKAPLKIALIAFDQAVLATNEGQHVTQALQAQFAPSKTELNGEVAELDRLKKELQAGSWSAAERASRQSVIDAKEKQYTREAEAAQKAYSDALQSGFQAVAAKVGPVAGSYAQQHGYTVLLNVGASSSAVMWAQPATDISQAVVAAYNAKPGAVAAANPAQTAAPATPAKVAIVNFQQAVIGTSEGKQAMQETLAKFGPQKAKIDGDSAEIERLKKELQSGHWPDAERVSRSSTIDAKQKLLAKEADAASSAYNAELQSRFNQVAQKYDKVLNDYVSRNGYTILFDTSNADFDKLSEWLMWTAPGVQLDGLKTELKASNDVTSVTMQAYDSGLDFGSV
jgi:Skp family chaperone for outer membrane proteins